MDVNSIIRICTDRAYGIDLILIRTYIETNQVKLLLKNHVAMGISVNFMPHSFLLMNINILSGYRLSQYENL